MSFMENQMLGYKSPLYGCRAAQLFFIGNAGRWWGTNPVTRTREEIESSLPYNPKRLKKHKKHPLKKIFDFPPTHNTYYKVYTL